ncbi:gamma-glutamylcyclotransferase [Acutalibacter sp. 1XD8-33]|uniref:gamma-glutamylcyclotransferase family protein n=1 Tax=Acutalibacter sp. 1XD8-33 TaxID=2320081 RepID=UPI000EA36A71|nr:gamma-glutamylcyclotransferase family protein [Acutalibacter sp. 1XD8-33]RKJ41914.1 gamma-glutamylcyclotransferase [Acutalibacter sp. 1XD8-33]
MKKYYLAYGSNLNREQMGYRCPNAQPVGTVQLESWRLIFRGSGTGNYLTIEPAPGYSVPVAVWAVTKADEAALDRYEGFPVFYRKETLPITYTGLKTAQERQVEAFVYLMNDGHPAGLPTTRYMDTCEVGYRDFGFDPEALLGARAYTREVMALERNEG